MRRDNMIRQCRVDPAAVPQLQSECVGVRNGLPPITFRQLAYAVINAKSRAQIGARLDDAPQNICGQHARLGRASRALG